VEAPSSVVHPVAALAVGSAVAARRGRRRNRLHGRDDHDEGDRTPAAKRERPEAASRGAVIGERQLDLVTGRALGDRP
jgi:hypothetical protein